MAGFFYARLTEIFLIWRRDKAGQPPFRLVSGG